MEPIDRPLASGEILRVRDAVPADAATLLEYIETVAAESDYLSFGPGEFELGRTEQAEVLARFAESENQMYVLGLIDDILVSALFFDGGSRPRLRHVGEFGMTVRKDHWRRGIGQVMLQVLTTWAESSGVVRKIDLRVRADNIGAIRMYERSGFKHQGLITNEMLVNGTLYDVCVMGLEIAAERWDAAAPRPVGRGTS